MFFQQLYQMACLTPVVVMASANPTDGTMTLIVTPQGQKNADAEALQKPLRLTGTPAEFDADFFSALKTYNEARGSLIEQVEATAEVLKAAKAEQVGKATKALKKPPTAKASAVPSQGGNDNEEEEDEGSGEAGIPAQTSGGANTTNEPAESGTPNLFA